MQWYIWLRHCTISQKVIDLIPSGGSLEYFIDLILSGALWPKGCPKIYRNEYQRYLLWVKAASA